MCWLDWVLELKSVLPLEGSPVSWVKETNALFNERQRCWRRMRDGGGTGSWEQGKMGRAAIISYNPRFCIFFPSFLGVASKSSLRWSIQASGGSNQAGPRGHILWDVGERGGMRQAGLSLSVKVCWQMSPGSHWNLWQAFNDLWSQSTLFNWKTQALDFCIEIWLKKSAFQQLFSKSFITSWV